jgi:hypothetical protein
MKEDNSPSLFPELDIKPSPQWEFAALPNIDFISDEPASVVAFLFQIDTLESVSGIYNRPVFQALLAGLRDLVKCRNKSLRESLFTVFAGDAIGYDVFVVALETKSQDITNFMAPYFRQIPGYFTLEATSSRDLLPAFRYDKGYVIEYSDGGLEGTVYEDTSEYHGSGLTIYRRDYRLPEDIRRKKSVYGRLLKPK